MLGDRFWGSSAGPQENRWEAGQLATGLSGRGADSPSPVVSAHLPRSTKLRDRTSDSRVIRGDLFAGRQAWFGGRLFLQSAIYTGK